MLPLHVTHSSPFIQQQHHSIGGTTTTKFTRIPRTFLVLVIVIQFLSLVVLMQIRFNDRTTAQAPSSSASVLMMAQEQENSLLKELGKQSIRKEQHTGTRIMAYVTMITNDDYFKGVVALSKSLKFVKSQVKLHCVITASVSQPIVQEMSQQRICEPILVQSIPSPYSEAIQARWADTFTKLRVFELIQFDIIVFLDADMIVLHNIDHLFDVLDGQQEKNKKHTIAAAMDCCDHFNSGLMVLRPNQLVFDELIQGLKSGKLTSYDKADQGLLNSYYGKNFIQLDFRYNADQLHIVHYPHAYNIEKDINVLHFVHAKPWEPNIVSNNNEGSQLFKVEQEELMKFRKIWKRIYDSQT